MCFVTVTRQIPMTNYQLFPKSEIGGSPYLDDDLTLPGSDRARDRAIWQSCSRNSYHVD